MVRKYIYGTQFDQYVHFSRGASFILESLIVTAAMPDIDLGSGGSIDPPRDPIHIRLWRADHQATRV